MTGRIAFAFLSLALLAFLAVMLAWSIASAQWLPLALYAPMLAILAFAFPWEDL